MAGFRTAQSTTRRVAFQAFLASDHLTPATGKTIAITISKNGAAFGNPSAGATNATAIASGWYFVDLSTTDTNTLGPLAVRGTEGTIDDVGILYDVVSGITGLDAAGVRAAVGLASANLDTQLDAIPTAIENRALASGTADSGTTTTMVDAARTEADTDYWAGMYLVITSGNIAGQARLITGFNAATDTITVSPAFTQAVSTNTYEIWAGGHVDTDALATSVWSSGTRLLTAGTNIVLAKGTGVTGFNDLDDAGVRSAVGLASPNLDAQLTTIDDFLDTEVAAIKAKTDNLPAAPAATGDVAALLTTQLTESYAADGVAPTLAQALMLIQQMLGDFSISGTTLTAKKLDGTTTAATFTLNSATAPTSITRAS